MGLLERANLEDFEICFKVVPNKVAIYLSDFIFLVNAAQ